MMTRLLLLFGLLAPTLSHAQLFLQLDTGLTHVRFEASAPGTEPVVVDGIGPRFSHALGVYLVPELALFAHVDVTIGMGESELASGPNPPVATAFADGQTEFSLLLSAGLGARVRLPSGLTFTLAGQSVGGAVGTQDFESGRGVQGQLGYDWAVSESLLWNHLGVALSYQRAWLTWRGPGALEDGPMGVADVTVQVWGLSLSGSI